MEITKEWIDQQRAVCNAATPGPWKSNDVRLDGMPIVFSENRRICDAVIKDGQSAVDADLIAAARTALPAALDALEAAYSEIGRLKTMSMGLAGKLGRMKLENNRLTAERDAAVEKAREANERKRGTMRRIGLYELLMKRLEIDGYLRKELCNVEEDDCPSEKEQGCREAEYCEGCERFRHDYQVNTDAPTGAESEGEHA